MRQEKEAHSTDSPGNDRGVVLLAATALGVLLFLVCANLLAVRETSNLISSQKWVEHSYEVLLTIHQMKTPLDSLDTALSSNSSTQSIPPARTIRTLAQQLEIATNILQTLVEDSPSQRARVAALHQETQSLYDASLRPDLLTVQSLQTRFQSLRSQMDQIEQIEQQLLQDREVATDRDNFRIILIRTVYATFSILAILVLFSLLFRDAARRRQLDKQLQSTNRRMRETVDMLENRLQENQLLAAARDELQLCTHIEEIYSSAVRYFARLLPDSSGAICILSNSKQNVEVVSQWGQPTELLGGFSLSGCCSTRSGQLRWRHRGKSEIHCAHFKGDAPENYLCLLLSAYGETIGILYIECSSESAVADVPERLIPLQNMAQMVALSTANHNLRTKLERQSIRDDLTNLFNRHFMEIALEREILRAKRHGRSVAVIMADIDHFKSFNDTYGHDAGDLVLKETADCLSACSRGEDVICRYGGEEFIIILPDTSEEDAVRHANFIRSQVRDISVRYRGSRLREITMSFGIASYPQNAESIAQLMRKADRALYAAKNAGRNCVIIHEDDGTDA